MNNRIHLRRVVLVQESESFNTIGKPGLPLLMLAKWYQDWSDPALD